MKKAIRCAALSVACLTLATALGARAGELTAHMESAQLIDGTIKFQTVHMGDQTLKFIEYTPRSNSSMRCQATLGPKFDRNRAAGTLTTDFLAQLSNLHCFPAQDSQDSLPLQPKTEQMRRKAQTQSDWSTW